MADPVQLVSGLLKRIVPNTTSAGAADAAKLVQLNGSGKLDDSLLSATALAGAENYAIVASEALSANDIINIFNSAGVAKMRKADATDATKPPMGFVSTAVAAGASGTARLGNGVITGMTGLTIGGRYFLSATTPGAITATPPSTTGNVVYNLGIAKSATEFNYIDDNTPVELG